MRPFLKATACNVLFDLGKMTGGDTYMNICATSMDMHDLRLAYRCGGGVGKGGECTTCGWAYRCERRVGAVGGCAR